MKTYTCDKCGIVITDYSEVKNQAKVPHNVLLEPVKTYNRYTARYDLCDHCIADLRSWITGETPERIEDG